MVFTKLHNDKFYILNGSLLITLFSFYIASSPNRAVSSLRLGYKKQSVNAHRTITAGFSHVHAKHINTLCGQKIELVCVKFVVHIVTTGL